MFWIFAAVVLVLAVYSSGFRKVLLWSAGIGVPLITFACLLVIR